jgi:DNA primase catalytic core
MRQHPLTRESASESVSEPASSSASESQSEPTSEPMALRSSGPADQGTLVAAHEDAATFYRRRLHGTAGDGPRAYLEHRGFAPLIGDPTWTLGYAPASWTALHQYLAGLGYGDETLLAAGLVHRTRRGTIIDRFRDRLTFGIRCPDGRLVGFTARKAPGSDPNSPKYLNTPATPIFDKGTLLFGLAEQAADLDRGLAPALVEGPLDALAIRLLLPDEVVGVAPCGTALTGPQLRAMRHHTRADTLVIGFDHDAAGQAANERAYLLSATKFPTIRSLDLGDATDPAEALAHRKHTGSHVVVGRPLADVIIETRLTSWANLDNAEAAIACIREVAPIVAAMPPGDGTRQIPKLCEATRLPHELITHEITDALDRLHHPAARPGPTRRRHVETVQAAQVRAG